MLTIVADRISVELLQAGTDMRVALGRVVRRLRQGHVVGEVTLSEVSVLSRLDRDGPTTPGCLAELDRVRPQAMGVTLAGLTKRGLVAAARCRGRAPGADVDHSAGSGSYAGGIAAGLARRPPVVLVRRRLDDPLREGGLSLLTPFIAFLLAELVHAPGVVAVVVAGLILTQAGPRVIRPGRAPMASAFWDLATFLLNGGLFVLVGLQFQPAVRGRRQHDLPGPSASRCRPGVVIVDPASCGCTPCVRDPDRGPARPCSGPRRVGLAGSARSTGWPASGAPSRSPRRSRCPDGRRRRSRSAT